MISVIITSSEFAPWNRTVVCSPSLTAIWWKADSSVTQVFYYGKTVYKPTRSEDYLVSNFKSSIIANAEYLLQQQHWSKCLCIVLLQYSFTQSKIGKENTSWAYAIWAIFSCMNGCQSWILVSSSQTQLASVCFCTLCMILTFKHKCLNSKCKIYTLCSLKQTEKWSEQSTHTIFFINFIFDVQFTIKHYRCSF